MASVHIGDEVSFINENIKGSVTSLKANGVAGVTIEDGFELEVHVSELVVTKSTVTKTATKPGSLEIEAETIDKTALKKSIYWHLQQTATGFRLSILNTNSYSGFAAFYRKGLTGIELISYSPIAENQLFPVADLKSGETGKWGKIHMQFLPLRNLPSVIPSCLNAEVLPGEILQEPEFGKNKGLSFWICNAALQKAPKSQIETEQFEAPVVKESVFSNIDKPAEIKDLHADALGIAGLQGDEILKLQMEAFRKETELAIAWKMPYIIFIHGIGTGVLKNLISLALKDNPNVKKISPADENKYGQGAIRIEFK